MSISSSAAGPSRFTPSHASRRISQARGLGPDEFLFFGVPPARVDLLRVIPGVEFDEAFARRIDVQLGGSTVHIVSKEDLIASKRAAGHEKDLRDVRALERA